MKRASCVVVFVLSAMALGAQQTLKVPDAAHLVGPPKGSPLRDAALARRTQEVGALLRCPVCQGMSVADSPAEMAVNMKEQVRELLARGYTEQQILSYFEQSYGQFVLLRPKFEGVTGMIWVLPLIALAAGGLAVAVALRKLSRPAENPPPSENSTEPSDPYLARVRDLVSGDPK